MGDGENLVMSKAEDFAVRIVKCSRYIKKEHQEYAIADQILRSGTSIGANLYESKFAQSRADFITKLHISLKEASETLFWLKVLYKTDLLEDKLFYSLNTDVKSIISLLVKILKRLKNIEDKTRSPQQTYIQHQATMFNL